MTLPRAFCRIEKVSVATLVPDVKTPKAPESTMSVPGCFALSFSLAAAAMHMPAQKIAMASFARNLKLMAGTFFTQSSWIREPMQVPQGFHRPRRKYPYYLLSREDQPGDMTKAVVRTVQRTPEGCGGAAEQLQAPRIAETVLVPEHRAKRLESGAAMVCCRISHSRSRNRFSPSSAKMCGTVRPSRASMLRSRSTNPHPRRA